MFALMGTRELYRHFLQQLQSIYTMGESTVITDTVFEAMASITKADIIKTPDLVLPAKTREQLNNCLQQLLDYKPLQYVTGEAWFYNMKFAVNESVLIPRPETEELVKLVIDHCNKIGIHKSLTTITDIGTGSGCIAIALKKNLPDVFINAIDVSNSALAVATKNAASNVVDINFIRNNFLDEAGWKALSKIDIIVSNPPYIPAKEKAELDKNVAAYEPETALFVPDETPLIFYEKIAAFGLLHLNEGGKIFVEIHENFGKQTADVFKKYYSDVELIKDIFGKERMIVAGNPKNELEKI